RCPTRPAKSGHLDSTTSYLGATSYLALDECRSRPCVAEVVSEYRFLPGIAASHGLTSSSLRTRLGAQPALGLSQARCSWKQQSAVPWWIPTGARARRRSGLSGGGSKQAPADRASRPRPTIKSRAVQRKAGGRLTIRLRHTLRIG